VCDGQGVFHADQRLCAGIAVDRERLSRLYGLSEAEIRVAVAMLATPDPAEVAKRCFISLHTVRSHLKAIFAKTDTQGQADLMKRLLVGPARRR
ncbi:MAG TPA: helix-turn-helix transcriptional regulator, partial [Paracoccaceae bacterium]